MTFEKIVAKGKFYHHELFLLLSQVIQKSLITLFHYSGPNEPIEPLSITGIKQVKLPGPGIVKTNMSQKECECLAKQFGLNPRQGSVTAIERATQCKYEPF